MDYTALTLELFEEVHKLQRSKFRQKVFDPMQGETYILKKIAHHDGDILPGEISSEMNVSSARIATALNSLEGKGLITRRIDPSDRRRILVSLTPEGKAASDEHHRAVIAQAAKMLSLLGEHDAREFLRIIRKLSETDQGGACQC